MNQRQQPRQGMPYYQQQQMDPSKMTNKDIERILGLQYSQAVKELNDNSKDYHKSYREEALRDYKGVINTSLDLMDKYNRMNLMLRQKAQQVRNSFC